MSKEYEFIKVEDMAYERQDAINRCASLGEKFIEHFKKIYNEPNIQAVNHWCNEMQGWLNTVREIVLKQSKKVLSYSQLVDWFFTKGSSIEILFSENSDLEDKYNEFIWKIIKNNYDVKETIEEVFGDKNGK